jgi:L-alanine-DL-glutamate epimerase-like enolase superfamily enzyme
MQMTRVCAIPMSNKVNSDATLIRAETDTGSSGLGAALGTPPVIVAIAEHELAPDIVGEDPMFSERSYEKMYNGSRATPALERGIA